MKVFTVYEHEYQAEVKGEGEAAKDKLTEY